jgi:hypothetical protein
LDVSAATTAEETRDREAPQFAPLLMLKRQQVLEANANSGHAAQSSLKTSADRKDSTDEDLLTDAMDAMNALNEATRSADALYEEVLGCNELADLGHCGHEVEYGMGGQISKIFLDIQEVDSKPSPSSAPPIGAALRQPPLAEDCSSLSAGQEISSSSSTAPCPCSRDSEHETVAQTGVHEADTRHSASCTKEVDSATDESPKQCRPSSPPRTVGDVVGSYAEAGWSVAEAFLSSLSEPSALEKVPQAVPNLPCVEGLLQVLRLSQLALAAASSHH